MAALTVVVVEDLKELRELLVRVLQGQGYHVIAVGHAEDALQLAQDEKLQVDILLSDWNLPGRPGPEVAQELRRRWPQLKVLMASGLPHDDVDLSWLQGCGEYLAKPFDFNVMLQALQRLQRLP